ncbi:MAG: hypothetical protein AB7F88_00425 [Pyrinomonadaceae bacterium]
MNSRKEESEKTGSGSKDKPKGGRVDRFFHYWKKFIFYRHLCTLLIVFLVYLWAKAHADQREAAQLKFVETVSQQTNAPASSEAEPVKDVFSGDAYATAARLRESGALLMAVSLSSFEEVRVNGKFPATGGEVLSGLQTRFLLPPGIEIKDGALRSAMSELKLNYRAEPFSFEIFSMPAPGSGGPALLFRFPLPPAAANSVMYFEAPDIVPLSAPFSATERITASGWKIRHWRGEALPLNEPPMRELREHDEWVKTQTQGR